MLSMISMISMISICDLYAIIDIRKHILESHMSRLLVRDLEPEIVSALKKRAAKHGCSAEAEHRAILKQSLLGSKKKTFAEVLLEMPNVGNDSDFSRADDSVGKDVFN